MTNTVASPSSSKRPAGAAPTGAPAAKRANTAKKPETDDGAPSTPAPEGERKEDDANGETKQPEEEMDEEARAKAARREARVSRAAYHPFPVSSR